MRPHHSGTKRKHLRLLARIATLLAVVAALLTWQRAASAQEDEEEEPPTSPPTQPQTPPSAPPGAPGKPLDFSGSLQILRTPGPDTGHGPIGKISEIFPDSTKVWMSVRDIDPVPVETARRGGKWICSSGCSAAIGEQGASSIGNGMLRSIKLQTPSLALPVNIFGREEQGQQKLDFDPILVGRRHYGHICGYKPIEGGEGAAGKPDKVKACTDGAPRPPEPDSGEITVGLEWPERSELADFRYLAIVDSCGNARVQPFRRTFVVPVLEVASGGCGKPDGKVLRIFPNGGWLRVTAFNLEKPATGNVVNVTYRVQLPALEDLVSVSPARLLFPDIAKDLSVDCGPRLMKAPAGPGGVPNAPPRRDASRSEASRRTASRCEGRRPASRCEARRAAGRVHPMVRSWRPRHR